MSEKHVVIYPSDGSGSGVYRMTWPGEAVRNSGKLVTVLPRSPQITVDQFGAVHGVNVGSADVVVFQRPGNYQFTQVIPILQSQGVRVIIDFDDSLSTIHPRNAAFRSYDPRVSRNMNWMHAARSAELADHVTVTTAALAEEYGKHGRVTVIPNHVPESYLKIQRPQNKVPIVGWAGWTDTHPGDLTVTGGMVNKVLIDTGAKLAAFGDTNIFRDLKVLYQPPHENWGFTSIPEYPRRLVGFDIGLVPLKQSQFNECKSFLKILEMASLGVVPVATPIGGNHQALDLGLAIPASTPDEWYNRVRELIVDIDYRLEMSQKVRDIASAWTIEANTDKWWSVWSA